ncbi:MAG: protein NO VEIN domain-containing protein [Cellulosilyticaceae bacterium]
MYDADVQYRCPIIRGKTKNELDNLLPAYANIIDEICPCKKDEFKEQFNERLKKVLKGATKKTLDNHRTEIAGKLFGMYYENENKYIYKAERTERLLNEHDHPAFFKDICIKFQFPNGMDKIDRVNERLSKNIRMRPMAYVLKCMIIAEASDIYLTKHQIGYYILNNLYALKGEAKPREIVDKIIKDIQSGVVRKISVPGKASSYCMQHITEQLNYLELANLIKVVDKQLILNKNETKAINYIAQQWNKPLIFDVYKYSMDTQAEKEQFYLKWQEYYQAFSEAPEEVIITDVGAFVEPIVPLSGVEKTPYNKASIKGTTKTEIGDIGEEIVLQYERGRVKEYNARLVNKVMHCGRTKGLGYDIQSILATGKTPEFVKYIEVKATVRVTKPTLEDDTWIDTVNLTRNEWVAAEQFGKYFYIYRVYLTQGGIHIYTIGDVYNKYKDNRLACTPVSYRLEFCNQVVDNSIPIEYNNPG